MFVPKSESTDQTLVLTNVNAFDQDTYRVDVSNGGGSVSSDPATVTVLDPELTPQGLVGLIILGEVGGTESTSNPVSTALSGCSRRTIQYWRKEGVPLERGGVAMLRWLARRANLPKGTEERFAERLEMERIRVRVERLEAEARWASEESSEGTGKRCFKMLHP